MTQFVNDSLRSKSSFQNLILLSIFHVFFRKTFVIMLLVINLFAVINTCAATEVLPAAIGYLDAISVTEDEFSAQGWVAANRPAQKVVALVIQLGDTTIYQGSYEKFERADVVLVTGRRDWVNSGWHVKSAISSNLRAGKYGVSAKAVMDSGDVIELTVNKQASKIEINPTQSTVVHTRIMVSLGLLGGVLLVISAFYFAVEAASKLSKKFGCKIHPAVVPAFSLAFLFAFLVGMGTTGSSFEFGAKQTPFVKSNSIHIWGEPQPIRSDEWLVFTPLAIAQANHIPALPIINQNLGEDGQNMLIVGMAGMPVHHISAFAKPATWGFHLLDLRRALSWYWWFPIFGCLFALWAVFSLISPNHWRIGFLVSLSFCSSAYVTAWSYWPAYAVFFPALMLYSSVAILRYRNNVSSMIWATLLGLSLAGFVLILYPPWQISLGYLFLFVGIGIVLRDKLYLNVNLFSWFSFALALGLAILILWNWWLDSESAIIAMMNTVYPGQRDSVVGGNINISDFLRGFTNLVTLSRMEGGYSNQSEIASFYYMIPSLLVLFSVRLLEKKIGAIHCLLLLFLVFTTTFMFIGIPLKLAKLTLWGRVPAARADLSLGLAYILLAGVLLVPNRVADCIYKIPVKHFAAIVSLAWGLIVVYALSKMPPDTLSGFSPSIKVAILLTTLFCSWWLAVGEYRKYLVLNLVFSFATVSFFNPLGVAPNAVATALGFAKDRSRVLVANTQVPAMFLLASGQSVSNGIFYYPQKTMWNRYDSDGAQANIYNRYQHLLFSLGDVPIPYYRIESPSADVVRIVVDTTHFDFSVTGASVFVAPSNDTSRLKLNSSLKFVSENDGWSKFVVLKIEDK